MITSSPTGAADAEPAGQLLSVVVLAKTPLTDDIVELTLGSTSGGPLPAWEPGAHIDLILGNELVRQYSLCSEPSDAGQWRVAVLREADSRGGSSWIHDEVRVGQVLSARGPRNHFALLPGKDLIFIAGGVGITPIRPMLAAAQAAGVRWDLHYGGRSRASMAYLAELRATYGDHVHAYPEDEVGLIPLDHVLPAARVGTLVYCCGPVPLLHAVEARCVHWPAGALHVEHFAPERLERDGAEDQPFEVVFKQSNVVAIVPPGRSIVQVAEDNDIPVITSCEEGICGTCETPVIDGEPDHRDSIMSEDERMNTGSIFICVSRCRSKRLVLDL